MSASAVSRVRVVVMSASTCRASKTPRPDRRFGELAQAPWQPEMREEATAAEPRDRGYAVALQGQDEQRVRSRDVGLRAREVAAERGLRVGARRHEQRRATPGVAVA